MIALEQRPVVIERDPKPTPPPCSPAAVNCSCQSPNQRATDCIWHGNRIEGTWP